MSKKDYIIIAELIEKYLPDTIYKKQLIIGLCKYFRKISPRFNTKKFKKLALPFLTKW